MSNQHVGSEEVENIAQEQREVYTHVAFKMVQAMAIIAPTVGAGRQLYRRTFSANRWLRNAAGWTLVVGPASGFAMAWLRLRNEPDIAIFDRAYRLRHNPTQVRVDDYAKVGAVLGALLTTTVFLKRASVVNTILGGASIGIGAGTITHTIQMMKEEGAKRGAKEAKEALPDPVKLAEGVASGKSQ